MRSSKEKDVFIIEIVIMRIPEKIQDVDDIKEKIKSMDVF